LDGSSQPTAHCSLWTGISKWRASFDILLKTMGYNGYRQKLLIPMRKNLLDRAGHAERFAGSL
tara:strand:+ start:276 stop:464 length:189 start_codon:yes stop_codon:yes gene_type:complete